MFIYLLQGGGKKLKAYNLQRNLTLQQMNTFSVIVCVMRAHQLNTNFSNNYNLVCIEI